MSHTVIQCLSHLLAMLSSTTTVQMAVAPSSSERKLKLQCSIAFSEINFGSWTKVTSCYIEAAMAGLCDEELHLVDAGCKAYLHFKVLKRDRTLCRDSLSLFEIVSETRLCTSTDHQFPFFSPLLASSEGGFLRQEPTRRVVQEGDGVLTFAIDHSGLNACTSHRQVGSG